MSKNLVSPLIIASGGIGLYFLYKYLSDHSQEEWYEKAVEYAEVLDYRIQGYQYDTTEIVNIINTIADYGFPINEDQESMLGTIITQLRVNEFSMESTYQSVLDAMTHFDPENFPVVQINEPFQTVIDYLMISTPLEIQIWDTNRDGILWGPSNTGLISMLMSRIFKNWHDINESSPSYFIPIRTQNIIVNGANIDSFMANALNQLSDIVVDPGVFSVIVPNIQTIFISLPKWKRNIIINESVMVSTLGGMEWGLNPDTTTVDWLSQFNNNPEMVRCMAIGVAVAILLVGILDPESPNALNAIAGHLAWALIQY